MATPVVGKTVTVSHDLLHKLGSKVYIKGLGVLVVEDLMAAHKKQSLDILVANEKQAKEFGKKIITVVFFD